MKAGERKVDKEVREVKVVKDCWRKTVGSLFCTRGRFDLEQELTLLD